MYASLIGHSGSSAFRLSTTTVSMSLTGSCFSSESAPRPLYGAFFVKEFARAAHLFPSSVSRFDLKVRFPDPRIAVVDARRSVSIRQVTSPLGRKAEPGSLQTEALFRGYNYLNAARKNLVFALGIG